MYQHWRGFDEAAAYSRAQKLKTQKQWYEWGKSGRRPQVRKQRCWRHAPAPHFYSFSHYPFPPHHTTNQHLRCHKLNRPHFNHPRGCCPPTFRLKNKNTALTIEHACKHNTFMLLIGNAVCRTFLPTRTASTQTLVGSDGHTGLVLQHTQHTVHAHAKQQQQQRRQQQQQRRRQPLPPAPRQHFCLLRLLRLRLRLRPHLGLGLRPKWHGGDPL